MGESVLIPSPWVAGDTIEWTTTLKTYTPQTHALTWVIRGADLLDVEAVADGDKWRTTIDGPDSDTLKSGRYSWTALATEITTGNRNTVGFGHIEVLPNPIDVALPYDDRTPAAIMLDAVNAAITARLAGGAVQNYAIKGRNLAYATLQELTALRDQLRGEVAKERAAESLAAGEGDPRRLWVKF